MTRRVQRLITASDGRITDVQFDDGTTLEPGRFVLTEAQTTWVLQRLAAGDITLNEALDELTAWAVELPGSPTRTPPKPPKPRHKAHVDQFDVAIAEALDLLHR